MPVKLPPGSNTHRIKFGDSEGNIIPIREGRIRTGSTWTTFYRGGGVTLDGYAVLLDPVKDGSGNYLNTEMLIATVPGLPNTPDESSMMMIRLSMSSFGSSRAAMFMKWGGQNIGIDPNHYKHLSYDVELPDITYFGRTYTAYGVNGLTNNQLTESPYMQLKSIELINTNHAGSTNFPIPLDGSGVSGGFHPTTFANYLDIDRLYSGIRGMDSLVENSRGAWVNANLLDIANWAPTAGSGTHYLHNSSLTINRYIQLNKTVTAGSNTHFDRVIASGNGVNHIEAYIGRKAGGSGVFEFRIYAVNASNVATLVMEDSYDVSNQDVGVWYRYITSPIDARKYPNKVPTDTTQFRYLITVPPGGILNAVAGLMSTHPNDIVLYSVAVQNAGVSGNRELWEDFLYNLSDWTPSRVGTDPSYTYIFGTTYDASPVGPTAVRYRSGAKPIKIKFNF